MAVMADRAGTAARFARHQQHGLCAPNPGMARRHLWPRENAALGTIGAADTTSVIIDGHTVAPTDPLFRYLGCHPGPAAASGGDANYWVYNSATGPDSITSPNGNMPWSVEFMHYGESLEWVTKGRGTAFAYRFRVNGDFVSESPAAGPANNGGQYFVPLAFPSAAHRHIRIDMGGAFFGGIHIGPLDTIYAVSHPAPTRVIVLSDSYAEGNANLSGTGGLCGFVPKLGDLMGWDDIWASGSGGTGYLNPGGQSRVTYRTRLANDVIHWEPSVVIVGGGANDYTYNPGSGIVTPAAIGEEAALVCAAIRESLPSTTLIVVGPWWWTGAPTEAVIAVRDAIRSAVAPYVHLWVDVIGGAYPYSGTLSDYANTGFFTGVGHVGAEVGFGTADIFIGPDGVHPTVDGYANIAHRIAAQLGTWIDEGMPDSP